MAGKAATELATFGAGCYWGTEHWFKKQFGKAILSAKVGFSGGQSANPTYEAVCSGKTGHAEVAQFTFDPAKVTFEALATFFWRMHDPTTLNKQGNDNGTQYRSVIFYHSDEQKTTALKVKDIVKSKWKNPIITEIVPFTAFYQAQEDHQAYLDKNPGGYCNHRIYWS